MSKAKSVATGAERKQNWLVRMPGGPTKLIVTNKELNQETVKKIYLSQLKFIRALSLDDPDVVWPLLKLVSDDDITKNYSWVIQESRRKNQRGVIKVVDGQIEEDVKELPERKRVATRVETTTG